MDQTLSCGQPLPATAYARISRRFLGLVLDGLVLFGGFAALAILAAATGATLAVRAVLLLLVLAAVFYDPLMVAATGGTLGHHWLNLRVVDDETGRNLPLGRALLRALVKGILGWASFVFVAVTQRHQALHDLASRSTVQVRDIARARASHYATERALEPEPPGVSRRRRAVVMLAYWLTIYVVMAIATAPFISDECAFSNRCSPSEHLFVAGTGVVWVGSSVWVLVRGWRGRLLGCRAKTHPVLAAAAEPPAA